MPELFQPSFSPRKDSSPGIVPIRDITLMAITVSTLLLVEAGTIVFRWLIKANYAHFRRQEIRGMLLRICLAAAMASVAKAERNWYGAKPGASSATFMNSSKNRRL